MGRGKGGGRNRTCSKKSGTLNNFAYVLNKMKSSAINGHFGGGEKMSSIITAAYLETMGKVRPGCAQNIRKRAFCYFLESIYFFSFLLDSPDLVW